MQGVIGAILQADDRIVPITSAPFSGGAAEAWQQCIVDLLQSESWVVSEQEGIIDRRTGHEAIAGVRRHRRRNGPVPATRVVASGIASTTLCGREARVRPADRFKSPHVDAVGNGGYADESAEAVIPSVARNESAALAPARGLLILGTGRRVGQMSARVVERPCAAHVDSAGRAAFNHVG